MGNKNQKPETTKESSVRIVQRTTADRAEPTQAIDLDEIVEQWIWQMWNRTRTKSTSRYKREELLVKINWKRVVFSQSDVRFQGLPPVRLPQSQTLFRTNFNNKTLSEQSYLLKTERSTRSTFKFTFQNRLIRTEQINLTFLLPEQIVEIGGGIQREQSIECGRDTVKEYDMHWNVNSQVSVPPLSSLYAELNIDEEEFDKEFFVSIRFIGRISATIALRQAPENYLKLVNGDIVQIIREMLESQPRRCNGLEILEDKQPVVQYNLRGKCSFRYGIEQHVLLTQMPFDSSISSPHIHNYYPSPPPTHHHHHSPIAIDYRPLRSRMQSSASEIRLHIDDEA